MDCSESNWKLLTTHTIRLFPLHFSSRASPCAIRFRFHYTTIVLARPALQESQYSTELTPPPIYMDSSVSLEDRIWFLRVCHHVPFALYQYPISNGAHKWYKLMKQFHHNALVLCGATNQKLVPRQTSCTRHLDVGYGWSHGFSGKYNLHNQCLWRRWWWQIFPINSGARYNTLRESAIRLTRSFQECIERANCCRLYVPLLRQNGTQHNADRTPRKHKCFGNWEHVTGACMNDGCLTTP